MLCEPHSTRILCNLFFVSIWRRRSGCRLNIDGCGKLRSVCEKDPVRDFYAETKLIVGKTQHKRFSVEGHVVSVISVNHAGALRVKELHDFPA